MRKRNAVLAALLAGALGMTCPAAIGAEAADPAETIFTEVLDGDEQAVADVPEENIFEENTEEDDALIAEAEVDEAEESADLADETMIESDEYLSDDGDEIPPAENAAAAEDSEWIADESESMAEALPEEDVVESEAEEAEVEEAIVTEGSCGTDAYWNYDPVTGVLSITGSGRMDTYSPENPAPWQSYAEGIQHMEIAEGITSLGSYACSGQSALATLKIPSSVTEIGDNAFVGCSATLEIVM